MHVHYPGNYSKLNAKAKAGQRHSLLKPPSIHSNSHFLGHSSNLWNAASSMRCNTSKGKRYAGHSVVHCQQLTAREICQLKAPFTPPTSHSVDPKNWLPLTRAPKSPPLTPPPKRLFQARWNMASRTLLTRNSTS